MTETDVGASFTEEEVDCMAVRWNLTQEMARRRCQRTANKPPDMKAAALWYAKNRIPVIPIHSPLDGGCSCCNPDCHSPGKHPRTRHGFNDATTDEAQINEWWESHPFANIGIPTGALSGFVVVDCDPRNGGPAQRDELVQTFGPIPETAEVITGGGGRHLFFRYGGGSVPKILAPGIDLKGDGGFVVAPPSLHPSGKRYALFGSEGPNAFLHVADAPEWLRKRISTTRSRTRTEVPENCAEWRTGQRNNKLTSVAGTMRRRGLSWEAIKAALLEENLRRCDPPLSEAEVLQIAESVTRYAPAGDASALADDKFLTRTTGVHALATRCLSDIDARPLHWLWPGRIARGKLTIIAGNPGLGNSQITASIAAFVTTGGYWPVDRQRCGAGDVLFLTAEDDPADILRPRLEAVGADPKRIHFVDGVTVGYAGDGTPMDRPFSLEVDIQPLHSRLAQLGTVAAVVIDPISAYMGGADSHKNAEVRGLLSPLSTPGARHDVAIIGVSHLTKTAGAQALMRVSGSLAYVAAARAVYLVAADPQDKGRRLFLPMKNNIAPEATGLAFRIEGVTVPSAAGPLATSSVVWEPEAVHVTADDVVQATYRPNELSAVEEVKTWLAETLVSGPKPAPDVIDQARAEGISKSTLMRARRALGVRTAKTGMKGGWVWALPAKILKTTEDAQDSGLSTFGDLEHLRERREEEPEL